MSSYVTLCLHDFSVGQKNIKQELAIRNLLWWKSLFLIYKYFYTLSYFMKTLYLSLNEKLFDFNNQILNKQER